MWSHGVISESTFELLNSVCSISQMIRESINGEISDACFSINDLVSQEMSPFINGYAINLDVCSSGDPTQTALSSLHSLTFTKRLGDDQSNPKPTSSTPLPQFSVRNFFTFTLFISNLSKLFISRHTYVSHHFCICFKLGVVDNERT